MGGGKGLYYFWSAILLTALFALTHSRRFNSIKNIYRIDIYPARHETSAWTISSPATRSNRAKYEFSWPDSSLNYSWNVVHRTPFVNYWTTQSKPCCAAGEIRAARVRSVSPRFRWRLPKCERYIQIVQQVSISLQHTIYIQFQISHQNSRYTMKHATTEQQLKRLSAFSYRVFKSSRISAKRSE